MTVSHVPHTVTELVGAFTGAPPARLADDLPTLITAVWESGTAGEHAVPVARGIVEGLDGAGPERLPFAAVLLGLLIEARPAATADAVTALVAAHADALLDRWRREPAESPASLALLYLLAHLPAERERVLAAADAIGVDPGDRSRLDRALDTLDPAAPVLGRAFPSPAAWDLDDDEQAFDQSWIDALGPDDIARHWDNDTETVLGHLGAKAYWAVRNGAPVPVVVDSVPPRSPRPPKAGTELFTRHASAFRCPDCGSPLAFAGATARCTRDGRAYAVDGGILDLTAAVGDGPDRGADFLFKLAEIPTMGFFYEAHARPNFLRLCGSNWGGAVTPADEDAYISEHVRPVEGPVLDVAAGAGRWTRVLADAVGPDRVVALDLALPMLATLRGRLPALPAVLSSAARLPFADASLGAALCWNALQAFPHDAAATVAEVGRCLRPGGTFSLLTFRNSEDPVYRYFVGRHHFPQHADGLHLFERDQVDGWLDRAGLVVEDDGGPGTFVIITARRPAR
ncbi:class I SAM-dependent methyltransferase [Actinomadura flavalba]|uniref:class I SAM-dependent methyltransferase n=1 Tax=Actinomadura flavalba TaxID=1120938 RepID=UPI0003618EFA|nr:class I SAM-dependent methyltransferase [Actinomadura flavalba]